VNTVLGAGRPFTRSEAISSGLPDSQLRGPRFRRVFHGVYVDAATPDSPDLRARAALLLFGPAAYASHVSAARLFGAPLPTIAEERVSVSCAGLRRVRDGIRCHVQSNPDPVVMIRGIRTVDAQTAFCQLATILGLVDLVVVGDHLVRHRHATRTALEGAAEGCRGRAGRLARRAASLVRDRVDSPMESRLRLLLVLAGIPEPEVNITVRDADGTPVRRYDLSWRDVRVVVEYDGRVHVERVDQWERDLERREALDDQAVRLLVVTARDIYSTPGRTIERVWQVLKARRLPGLPPRPSDEWRAHFPER
jgi:hypothetical protein